ncbi:acyl carrier protein [Kitasatospora sp. NPDC018619]|uniref:acyl carrier protein n=1 Tax=unclassified Kitasatospora TaxID=2633591 RepID=UPI0037A2917D
MATTETALSPQELGDWLTERVAFYLECPAEDVDRTRRLVEMGLDSIYALTLCGDIEDHFGIAVEPTLAWDHPTVEALTAFLGAELGSV